MPGSMLALVIGQVSARGFWAAPLIVAGHAILEFAVVIGLMVGLRAVLAKASVRSAIGIVGGLALIYMGYDMVRAAGNLALDGAGVEAMPWGKLIIAGIAVCAANPYFTAWWATIGIGQVAHIQLQTPVDYAAFYIGHELSDLSWYSFIGLVIMLGRRSLNLQWLTIACGVLVVALGVWFVISGAHSVRELLAEHHSAARN